MAVTLTGKVAALLADEDTLKILATVDSSGVPHAVVKQSFQLNDEGQLVYLELLESSRTNRNLVGSLWFDRRIAIHLAGRNNESWQIKGRPVKAHICGPVFRRYYEEVRRKLPGADLATVWLIEPEEVIDETVDARQRDEERLHPFFGHLDRLEAFCAS